MAKQLVDKEDVEIEGKIYFISTIPAWEAHKIFLAGFGSSQNNALGGLPPALMEELLSYCGTYNAEGAEVQFINPGIINMFVKDMFVLLKLEHLMVRKNFGFLFDGRGVALASELNPQGLASPQNPTETSTPSSAI